MKPVLVARAPGAWPLITTFRDLSIRKDFIIGKALLVIQQLGCQRPTKYLMKLTLNVTDYIE